MQLNFFNKVRKSTRNVSILAPYKDCRYVAIRLRQLMLIDNFLRDEIGHGRFWDDGYANPRRYAADNRSKRTKLHYFSWNNPLHLHPALKSATIPAAFMIEQERSRRKLIHRKAVTLRDEHKVFLYDRKLLNIRVANRSRNKGPIQLHI